MTNASVSDCLRRVVGQFDYLGTEDSDAPTDRNIGMLRW
jgi:hypothetical protein